MIMIVILIKIMTMTMIMTMAMIMIMIMIMSMNMIMIIYEHVYDYDYDQDQDYVYDNDYDYDHVLDYDHGIADILSLSASTMITSIAGCGSACVQCTCQLYPLQKKHCYIYVVVASKTPGVFLEWYLQQALRLKCTHTGVS